MSQVVMQPIRFSHLVWASQGVPRHGWMRACLSLFGLRREFRAGRLSAKLFFRTKGRPLFCALALHTKRAPQAWVYSATFVSYAMSHFSRKCYTNVKKQLVVHAGMSKSLLSRLDTGYVPSPSCCEVFCTWSLTQF